MKNQPPFPKESVFPTAALATIRLFLLLAGGLLLEHLLDDLLLLDQESPDDPVADAVTAS
jgi:hypothetical protein